MFSDDIYKEITHASFPLVYKTEKAFLLQGKKGRFWIPKSIILYYDINRNKVTGWFPDAYKPEYLADPLDALEDLDA